MALPWRADTVTAVSPVTVTGMTDDGSTSELKARRKLAGGRRRSPLDTPPPAGLAPSVDITEQELPPLPQTHASMGAALARPAGLPVLHPLFRRHLSVAELGGHVPDAALTDYVVATFDATEQMLPPGCKTPVSRLLWKAGQHVRRDVMQTYLDTHPELVATAIIDVELPENPAPEGTSEVAPEGVSQDGAQGDAATVVAEATQTDPEVTVTS